MQTWIVLFRGINVGGKNILPMAKLKSDLESLKFSNVRTYIQSGNVVLDAKTRSGNVLQKKIAQVVEAKYGFRPQVLILDCEALLHAVQANPFPDAVSDPSKLHFFFLSEPASEADLQSVELARSATEEFQLTDSVFYLHAPDGIGRSKLAANAEKYLNVVTTARNFRTVEKLRSMIEMK